MGRTGTARERLLHTVVELFAERSYGAITIDDICARANVKKGSFYYYFESKSALTVDAWENVWQTFYKPALDDLFSPNISPQHRITAYLHWLRDLQLKRKREAGMLLGSPLFSLACELGAQEPDVSRKLREILALELRYFESALREAPSGQVLESSETSRQALCLRGAVKGLVSQARIMNDEALLEALIDLPAALLRLA